MSILKYQLTFLCILFVSVAFARKPLSMANLRCESMVNPLGVTAKAPHFSRWINSIVRDTKQKSYHILVSDTPEMLKKEKSNC